MIPAVLSAVFVLYLYRTLNAPDSSDAEVVSGGDVADQLASRIASLQARLDELAEKAERENHK